MSPSVPSTQLFPEVVDASTLQPRLTSNVYLPIGMEGQAVTAGTGSTGILYAISRVDEANTLFGAQSSLAFAVKAVLDRVQARLLPSLRPRVQHFRHLPSGRPNGRN